jgi:hypothetical protein
MLKRCQCNLLCPLRHYSISFIGLENTVKLVALVTGVLFNAESGVKHQKSNQSIRSLNI